MVVQGIIQSGRLPERDWCWPSGAWWKCSTSDLASWFHLVQTESEKNPSSPSLTCQAFRKEGPVQFWGKWPILDNTQKQWIIKSWWKYNNPPGRKLCNSVWFSEWTKKNWGYFLENSCPRFSLTKATFGKGLPTWPACSMLGGWHMAGTPEFPTVAATLAGSIQEETLYPLAIAPHSPQLSQT